MADFLVLGAGMVGVSTALALQEQGHAVAGEKPQIVLPDISSSQAEPAPNVRFTATPVVQAVPEDEARAEAADAPLPVSLAAYVAQNEGDDALSPQMRCLAGAIYFEARGESLEGQLAVGRVIVNRTKSHRFPSTYCGVVYQRSQFSFVRGGSMPKIRTGSRAWQRAVAIARIADEGEWNTRAKGALFFHAARVRPGWRLTRLAQVDNHVFYR